MNSKKILEEYNKKTLKEEDFPVLDFLRKLPSQKKYSYLEVGAGLARFPLLVKEEEKLPTLDITCLEINRELAERASGKGLKAVSGSVLALPFETGTFDIIHASHLIEHFGYPDITKVLDEIFRVVKTGGYVIIRSPLMHHGFYNDIDHVRPYSPKCIMQYFENMQQQKKGDAGVKLVTNWNRREAMTFSCSFPGVWHVNMLLKILLIRFGYPRSRPNGYVAIFQKT